MIVCLLPLVISCATSSVERLSETPNTVRVPGLGEYAWTEERGWVMPDRGSWGRPAQVRAFSFQAYQAGKFADALAGFQALKGMAVDSNEARAVIGKDLNFHIAECYFNLGNYEAALESYQSVYLQDFPDQSIMEQSFQRVYHIGLAYLKGEVPCQFMGIRYRCEDRGIDILAHHEDGLISRFPLLPYADNALIEIANYYYDEKEYPEAVPLYDRVASDVESEWSDYAEFRAAMSTFKQVRGADYDQKTMIESERRLTKYLEGSPGNYSEEARKTREAIREMEGEKNLRIAKFYLRESKPEACHLYLEKVLRNFPNSSAAEEAREIQSQLDRLRDGV